MSQSAVQSFQTSKIDISKYVSAEEKARITQSVNNCMSTLSALETSAMSEFGLAQPTAQAIAVQVFNTQYMLA
jgi:hypothetical protein